MEKIVHY